MTGALSETLGHGFHDEALLKRALTHAGADAAHSNERLEFLGDSVLGLVVTDTLYRIHGSNEPWTIGTQVSSGCIRMRNEDVIDLYERVKVGTKVVVI